MNGDVNGMASPDQTKVVSENKDNKKDDENCTNTENCDVIKSGSINGAEDNGEEDIADQYVRELVDESSIHDTNKQSLETLIEESTENVTKGSCDNGNQSDPESTNSSHTNCKISDLQETDQINDEIEDECSINKNGTVNEIDQNSINEDETGDDSMAEEGSANSAEAKAEYTVSIDSDSDSVGHDDDTSQESQSNHKISDTIVLDSEKRPSGSITEVHEIDSDYENDDCVIASEEIDTNKPKEKVQLRRSSRAVKRKRYTDDAENGDESDIEEVEPVDPLIRKSKPIVINDTRALVAMAAKQMKYDHINIKKKEPTVVIIDSNTSLNKLNTMHSSKNSVSSNNSINPQSLYQSIIARGTTVTPVSSKNNNTSTMISQNSQNTQNPQPAILPSLTDDMFVVEAPSFIVPYVYEKPSVTAFREFVDKLGKQLEEDKIKEEMIEKAKREKEKQDKREKGEDIESDNSENINSLNKSEECDEEETNKKKKSKKEKRRNEEDDASWDGESATESEDEVLSDVDDKIVVKDKVEAIDQIKVVADLTVDKICSSKSHEKSSMDCSLGKFFINIGLNLVQEYVQSDLLKQQNRKLYKEKKSGHSTKATESSIAQLMKNLELSKENNAPYNFTQKKCEFCTFKTESKLIMSQHLETPHMKNNVYKCNFCTFEIRSPHEILYHMESVHNIRGKLEKAPSLHQCTNCQFEDNGKGKLARHLITCAKKFKPDSNLAPPIDWEPPAKIPKLSRPRNNVMSPYQNAFNRSPVPAAVRAPVNVGPLAGGIPVYRPRGRSPISVPQRPPVHGVPIMRGPSMVRQNNTSTLNIANNYQINNNKPKSSHQPSISITPLPRQPAPNQASQPTNLANNKNSFVICEICDGYIKDLEQLRNHMQWIHKVKIHPKMIYNRPPLNCQKCQFRFFTDQGFERHLLGSHGLVTSSMQEAANKGKDAGRCPVCGRVYQWKLLNHVARDHNMTLKPGHLSYKCTVCTATFGMYKQFENHVYSAHSVVAKRVMDKNKTASQPSKTNETLKPLKINEEITIIPQSVKSTATKPAKDK
ncbi:unnamed protein product [Diatraea saccharalis]|uniref:MOG interacting and ectopic P-granules protein 1 n=1 Tax=Diatraea saccharalis TaxID=40085 RepID=A0A9N9N353_9NEOP|nr:unnamed protein product [Diatraea saccharalis]